MSEGTDPTTEPGVVDDRESGGNARVGDLVADHFRHVEVLLLARMLATTLAGALPSSVVRTHVRRTIRDRMNNQPGRLLSVTIHGDGIALTLTAPASAGEGDVKAAISVVVDGIVQSTAWVSVPTWIDQLARVLNDLAERDEAARRALEHSLLT